MSEPGGRLSPAQYEILQAIWDVGPPGATTLQIWEIIAKKRSIVRTTVLNAVDRLETRGWLRRETELKDGIHFWPTKTREEIEAMLANDFVECFFKGSASQLVLSLLGKRNVSQAELADLKKMIADAESATKSRKNSSKRKRR